MLGEVWEFASNLFGLIALQSIYLQAYSSDGLSILVAGWE